MTNKALDPDGTIALFCSAEHHALREKISGVYSAATKWNWQVFQTNEVPTPKAIRSVTRMINPIGIIVDPIRLHRALIPESFGPKPIVLLGRDYHQPIQVFDCSRQDVRQPVQSAIALFDDFGPLGCLAYVGHPSHASWSRERGDIFREYAIRRSCYFEYGGPNPESYAGSQKLVRWLKALPKPAGLLLATDHLAPSVFAAIHRAKIAIPDEIAVVSVDDIHQICLNVAPTLTSVNVNFFRAGENAVELLRRRLLDPARPVETLTYGVLGITKRASTRKTYADKRVTKAMAFIGDNTTAKISSKDVVRVMGCGRRQGEQVFRRHIGSSILHVIQASRLEKAMSLLESGNVAIEDIPAFCGYDSPAFFKTIFKRETGMTMREWRKSHRQRPMSAS